MWWKLALSDCPPWVLASLAIEEAKSARRGLVGGAVRERQRVNPQALFDDPNGNRSAPRNAGAALPQPSWDASGLWRMSSDQCASIFPSQDPRETARAGSSPDRRNV